MNKWFLTVLFLNGAALLIMISLFSSDGSSQRRFQISLRQMASRSIEVTPPPFNSTETGVTNNIDEKEDQIVGNSPRFFKHRVNGHDPYSFFLYGVMPVVDCSNFSNHEAGKIDPGKVGLIGEAGVRVKTTILHDFSPTIDEHLRSMFQANVVRETWFEVHPFQISCLPDENELLYCSFRVWLHLDRFEGMDKSMVRNRFQDSYLYSLKLDKNLKIVPGSAGIIGIPAPVQDTAFNGPEDPRVFRVNGTTFVNFIMGHAVPNVNFPLRHQHLWDTEESVFYDIQVNRFQLHEWEKNWTPWVMGDDLYFIYQFTPILRVMRCQIQRPPIRTVSCSFFIGQPPYAGLGSSTNSMLLRGGTPIVPYTVPNYYLAITHSVQGYSKARRMQNEFLT